MHCVDFILSGTFEDMGIYLSVMGRYNPTPPSIKAKLKYVKNAHIFKITTQKKQSYYG